MATFQSRERLICKEDGARFCKRLVWLWVLFLCGSAIRGLGLLGEKEDEKKKKNSGGLVVIL